MDSKLDIEFLINTCAIVEKSLLTKDLDTVNIYFHNSLIRINRIMSSIYTLNEDPIKNKYAIYILLRPLVLDCLYFNYLLNIELRGNENNKNLSLLDEVAFDCLTDGVKDYHKNVVKNIKNLDKIKQEEIERNFKKIFDFAIECIPNNFSSIQFYKINPEFANMSAKSIESKFKSENEYTEMMLGIYSLFSKYDHNTGVGYFDYLNAKDFIKPIENCIRLLRKGYMNLLYIIDLQNDLIDIRDIYMTELKMK